MSFEAVVALIYFVTLVVIAAENVKSCIVHLISIQQHQYGKSTDPVVLFEKNSKNQLLRKKTQKDVQKFF